MSYEFARNEDRGKLAREMALSGRAPVFVPGRTPDPSQPEIGPLLPAGTGLFGGLRYVRIHSEEPLYRNSHSCRDCYISYYCGEKHRVPRIYPLSEYRLQGLPQLPPDLLFCLRRLICQKLTLPEIMALRRASRAWRDWLDREPETRWRLLELAHQRAQARILPLYMMAEYFKAYRQVRGLMPSYSPADVWCYFLGKLALSTLPEPKYLRKVIVCLRRIREQARVLLKNEFLREKAARKAAREQSKPKYYRRFFSCCGLSDSDSEYETEDESKPQYGLRYLRNRDGTYRPAPCPPPPVSDSDSYEDSDTTSEED